MAPGVVSALIVGVLIIGGTEGAVAGLLILSAWELIAGVILFMLSKGILHRCDMPTIKPRG
jgi:hypothetical protein